jgi:hypothetical protein
MYILRCTESFASFTECGFFLLFAVLCHLCAAARVAAVKMLSHNGRISALFAAYTREGKLNSRCVWIYRKAVGPLRSSQET